MGYFSLALIPQTELYIDIMIEMAVSSQWSDTRAILYSLSHNGIYKNSIYVHLSTNIYDMSL